MRWSNWWMGSSPASLESWPGDGSITSGVPKKSRTWGQAEGILTGALRRKDLAEQLTQFDADGVEGFQAPRILPTNLARNLS
jgi:hypothetical protein